MDVHFGPRTEVTEDRSDQGPKWMYPVSPTRRRSSLLTTSATVDPSWQFLYSGYDEISTTASRAPSAVAELLVFISYHIISYQGFVVRSLLREPRPWVHYKSQPDAKAQRETQKSTNVKILTKIE